MKKKIDFAAPFRVIIALLFLAIITLTCTQVICRYVFNNSLIWSEELVRFMVIWMCMLSAGILSFDDSHMCINSVVERFPIKMQFLVYTLRQILIIGFSIASALASFKLVKAAYLTFSGALNISFAFWRVAGTIGLILVAIYTVIRYFYDLQRFIKGEFYLGEKSNGEAQE